MSTRMNDAIVLSFRLERDPLAHVLDMSALIHHLDVKILISPCTVKE